MDPNQAEEMRRTAEQFAEAVRELSQSVNRLAEHEEAVAQASKFWEAFEEVLREQGENWRVLPVVPYRVRLPEKEAAALAVESVREVRRELWSDRVAEAPTPTPEEIREWELRREEQRKPGGYQPR